MEQSQSNFDSLQARALANDASGLVSRRQEILESSMAYKLLFQSETQALQDLLDYSFTAKLAKEKPEMLVHLRTQVNQADVPTFSTLARLQSAGLPPEVAFELQIAGEESPEWKQFWFPEFGTPDLSDMARVEAKRFSYEWQNINLQQELNSVTDLPDTAKRVQETLMTDRREFQELAAAYHQAVESSEGDLDKQKALRRVLEGGLHMQRVESMLAAAALLDPASLEQTKQLQNTAMTWDESFEEAGLEASSAYAISMPKECKTVMDGVSSDLQGALGYAYSDKFAMFRPDLADVMAQYSVDYPLIDHTVVHELVHLNQKTSLSRLETVTEQTTEPYGMRELVEGLTEYKTVEVLEQKFGPSIEADYKAKHPAAQYTAYYEMGKTIVEAIPELERDEKVRELFTKEWYRWNQDNHLSHLNIRADQVEMMVEPVHRLSNAILRATDNQPTPEQIREYLCIPYQEMMQDFATELNPEPQILPEPLVKQTTLRDRLAKNAQPAASVSVMNQELDFLMQQATSEIEVEVDLESPGI